MTANDHIIGHAGLLYIEFVPHGSAGRFHKHGIVFADVFPVAGLMFTQTAMRSVVTEAIAQCAYLNIDCYLIDDGGFVVFVSDLERTESVRPYFAY
jgi:hypothetical protein